MSHYVDAAAIDEDREEDDDSDAAQPGTQYENDDGGEESGLDDRIAELPEKIRLQVIKRLAKGGDGDSSYDTANAKDKKWVDKLLADHAKRIRKARQKNMKSQVFFEEAHLQCL